MANLPVPVMRTWSVGDLETAALFNSQIRDALSFVLNVPLYRGHQASSQNVTTSTWTQIQMDTADIDTYTGWSALSNTRYTAQLAGYYDCFGIVGWAGSNSGTRGSAITVNGAAVGSTTAAYGLPPTGAGTFALTADLIYLNVGDYISLWGFQSSGATLATLATASRLVAKWEHQ